MPTVSRQTTGRRRLRPPTQRSPSARARAGRHGAAAAAPGAAPGRGGPRRRLGWPTNLHVLLHHLLRGVSQEDVEVENSPDCPVSDGRRRLHGDLWRERTRRSVWDGPCPSNRREPSAGERGWFRRNRAREPSTPGAAQRERLALPAPSRSLAARRPNGTTSRCIFSPTTLEYLLSTAIPTRLAKGN